MDWGKQPSTLKFYPSSFKRRVLSQSKEDKLIYHIAGITATKRYPGVEYFLRTNPSAGALYPNELYMQIREVDGFEDGIYHYEVGTSSLTLLYALEDDGVEPLLGYKTAMRGFLFFISGVYHRSSWKYKNRGFRYVLLDAGHLIGAIEASSIVYEHAYAIKYDFDKIRLNTVFGFTQSEQMLVCVDVAVPSKTNIVPLKHPLPHQAPSNQHETNELIERAYQESLHLSNSQKQSRYLSFTLRHDVFEECILKRRSIREFSGASISSATFDTIKRFVSEPIISDCDEDISIYYVLNRVEKMPLGLYYEDKYLKTDNYQDLAGYLCLEQALGSQSAVSVFLTSKSQNYQAMYQKAGIIGHRYYLISQYLGLGCSGIGAYYDDEVNDFLENDEMVLYGITIGK